MSPGEVERKLTAIFSADVKGYSRLMSEDEEATIRALTENREMMAALIAKHRGRVVDAPGDNLLAEFASVVDAVQSAVEVQKALSLRNAGLPVGRRMEFRVGINLGDVVVEGERIYGDGVNIAARLENLSDPRGICISGTAFDQIETKLPLGYEFIGEQTVKNIAKPVRAYRLRLEPDAAPAGRGAAAGPRVKKARQYWKWAALGAGLVAVALFLFMGKVLDLVYEQYFSRASPRGSVPATSRRVRRRAVIRYLMHGEKLPMPDKPSIAVLPFANMSGDREQEYFSDGITEDLITDLSKISGLFVISRNSSFTYKGKTVKPEDVSRELGVRYILEGSVRKAGGRVRITAQLIDATTGFHVWAERYDRELAEIFKVQDEVAQKIVSALKVKLTAGERERVSRRHTDNLEAYDFYLRGMEIAARFTREGNTRARGMFEKAIELDPKYADAYAGLGRTYLTTWQLGWSDDPRTLDRAFELALKGKNLDPNLATLRGLLAHVYVWRKRYDSAIAEARKVIDLDPNSADGYQDLAEILTWAGRAEEAVGLVKKAMRLNPDYPFHYLWALGHAQTLAGQIGEAIESFKEFIERNPDFMPVHVHLAFIYTEMDRLEEARSHMAHVKRLSPGITLDEARKRIPYRNEEFLDHFIKTLEKVMG